MYRESTNNPSSGLLGRIKRKDGCDYIFSLYLWSCCLLWIFFSHTGRTFPKEMNTCTKCILKNFTSAVSARYLVNVFIYPFLNIINSHYYWHSYKNHYDSFESFSYQFELQHASQISGTLLSILADLNNAVVWMVSTCLLISNSSNLLTNSLGIVPSAPITIAIIVSFMLYRFFFSSLARSKYLSLFFSFVLQWSTSISSIRQVLFFCWLSLGLLVWSRLVRGAFNKFPDFFVQVFKIVLDSWKFSMLLLYMLDDWSIFYDFRFKWTATAAIRIHPTKVWLSQLVNFKNAIWMWGHFRRTICNKILF